MCLLYLFNVDNIQSIFWLEEEDPTVFGYGGSRMFFQVPEIVDSMTPPPTIARHRIYDSAIMGRALTKPNSLAFGV